MDVRDEAAALLLRPLNEAHATTHSSWLLMLTQLMRDEQSVSTPAEACTTCAFT